MSLPPNIPRADARRQTLGLLAIGAVVLGAVGFIVLDYAAFLHNDQDTVSEMIWSWLAWGPASYVALGGFFVAVLALVAWLGLHLFWRGRLG